MASSCCSCPGRPRSSAAGRPRSGVDAGPAGRLGFGQVLRFDTGPVGHGALGWALLVAAALPLVIGRGWRLAWAARLWVVAIVFFWLTWAGGRGWIPALPAEVGLAPAAAALAGSVALGAVAFELDLPGYRFGWRQLAAAVAGLALAVSSIPMLIASGQGRWHLPTADASSVLAFLPNSQSGDYRVLWVGAPDALPLAGRPLDSGIGYGTSYDGEPDVDRPVDHRASRGPRRRWPSDLRLVQNRLDHQARPSAGAHGGALHRGAQPQRPGRLRGRAVCHPGASAGRLAAADRPAGGQRRTRTTPCTRTRPGPRPGPCFRRGRPGGGRRRRPRRGRCSRPISPGPRRCSPGPSPTRARGRCPPARPSTCRRPARAAGDCTSAATSVAPQPAFGWAMSFAVPAGAAGPATLAPAPVVAPAGAVSSSRSALWLAAIAVAAVDLRRRRAEHPPTETVRPEWFAPMSPAAARAGWRRGGPGRPRRRRPRRATRCGSMSDPARSASRRRPRHRSGGAARRPSCADPRRPGRALVIGGLIDRAPRPGADPAAASLGPARPGGGSGPGPVLVVVLRRRDRRRTAAGASRRSAARGGGHRQQRAATRRRGRHPGSQPGAAGPGPGVGRPGQPDRRSPRTCRRGRRGSGPSSTSTPAPSPSSSRSTGRSGGPSTPCATAGSSQWYFATGATLINASVGLSLLNPYPTDAVVDLSFTTDQGVEQPQEFQGLVVPPDGLLTVNLGDHLRRRQAIATTVTARSGRLVAWKTDVVTPPARGEALLGTPGRPPARWPIRPPRSPA